MIEVFYLATNVSAVYENGVLRLLAPLPLPENTPVVLPFEVLPHNVPEDPRGRIRAALITVGRRRAQQASWSGRQALSVEEGAALAQPVAKGRPLSQLIDEVREDGQRSKLV